MQLTYPSRWRRFILSTTALVLVSVWNAPGWGKDAANGIQPSIFPNKPACYDLVEFQYGSFPIARGQNPYDPASIRIDAHIATPSGASYTVPAFQYEPFRRSVDTRGQEQLRPNGSAGWVVRYTPRESGTHQIKLLAVVDEGEPVRLSTSGFEVAAAETPRAGFLRVNPEQPTRFRFDSGRGWFALGHNVCWVKQKNTTQNFDMYFDRMAAAGENFTRIWLCTWGIKLDGTQPYTIHQPGAWQLDHVLREAAKRGIYIKLCFDNFYDFVNNFNQSPFAARNGGPCHNKIDFFVNKDAKRLYRARLRYLVARYGAFTSLMAWELWNEMNYALTYFDAGPSGQSTSPDDLQTQIYLPWTEEMANTLEELDPFRHMITTSLGLNTNWPALWNKRALSFTQYHSYIHYLDYLRPALEQDAAALVLEKQAQIANHGKPYLLGEFGYMGEGATSSMNPGDPTGIALHNGIWAAALSGAAGTPMLWWWDNYIHPNNLYYHYKALSTFLKDVDWTQPLAPMQSETLDIRVLALRGEQQVLLWIQNRENTWHNRIKEKQTPHTLDNVSLVLEGFPGRRYRVEWYDTYQGRVLSSYPLDTKKGTLRLRLPNFQFDIAAKMTLLEK